MVSGPATIVVMLLAGVLLVVGALIVGGSAVRSRRAGSCPKCGHRNARRAAFCAQCGEDLQQLER